MQNIAVLRKYNWFEEKVSIFVKNIADLKKKAKIQKPFDGDRSSVHFCMLSTLSLGLCQTNAPKTIVFFLA